MLRLRSPRKKARPVRAFFGASAHKSMHNDAAFRLAWRTLAQQADITADHDRTANQAWRLL